ncbi:hypothetical protein GCM10010172_09380 [Paractinoplanes ferrugineus]|uniref:Uncharacterized protein n=1 Tax=Paractinoplanes ferrugineus TaxID=113564 RepID=A0A919IWN6_9ACTN|nr:hypothetical protein [Actinoplanes ferrugineus]GIE09503.1 hypothetical protein Afe05nite_13430 [Actinoplanes ferrugineus]
MKNPNSRITFPGDGPWVAVSQHKMQKWATDEGTGPLAIRVMFAAIGHQNSTGHAELAKGELCRILGRADKETGRLEPAGSDTVSRAIRNAKASGFIAPESGARCLVVPRWVAIKRARDAWTCRVHGPQVA